MEIFAPPEDVNFSVSEFMQLMIRPTNLVEKSAKSTQDVIYDQYANSEIMLELSTHTRSRCDSPNDWFASSGYEEGIPVVDAAGGTFIENTELLTEKCNKLISNECSNSIVEFSQSRQLDSSVYSIRKIALACVLGKIIDECNRIDPPDHQAPASRRDMEIPFIRVSSGNVSKKTIVVSFRTQEILNDYLRLDILKMGNLVSNAMDIRTCHREARMKARNILYNDVWKREKGRGGHREVTKGGCKQIENELDNVYLECFLSGSDPCVYSNFFETLDNVDQSHIVGTRIVLLKRSGHDLPSSPDSYSSPFCTDLDDDVFYSTKFSIKRHSFPCNDHEDILSKIYDSVRKIITDVGIIFSDIATDVSDIYENPFPLCCDTSTTYMSDSEDSDVISVFGESDDDVSKLDKWFPVDEPITVVGGGCASSPFSFDRNVLLSFEVLEDIFD